MKTQTPQQQVREIYSKNLQGQNIDHELAEYIKKIVNAARNATGKNERSEFIASTIGELFTPQFDGRLRLTAPYQYVSAFRARLAALSTGYDPWCAVCSALGWALESIYVWVHVFNDGSESVAGPNEFKPDGRLDQWLSEAGGIK